MTIHKTIRLVSVEKVGDTIVYRIERVEKEITDFKNDYLSTLARLQFENKNINR